jgi:two-component system response regulator FixJ
MSATIFLVDDDDGLRRALTFLLRTAGHAVRDFAAAEDFLESRFEAMSGPACLVTDIRMPGMDGLSLQTAVTAKHPALPVILITGHGDVPLAVRAMRAGAFDFLEKPFSDEALLSSIANALEAAAARSSDQVAAQTARAALANLTAREREVADLLAAGETSKSAGRKLGISDRTVEVHRARVMEKMGARSLADLVRSLMRASSAP